MAHTDTPPEPILVPEPPRTSDSSHARIARGRLGTVAATLLALAAGQGGSSPSPSPNASPIDRTHPEYGQPWHAVSPLDYARDDTLSPSGNVTVENFRKDGTHFTCTFGDLAVAGDIAEDGTIAAVRFGGLSFRLSDPTTEATLARFLRNATGMASLLTARGLSPTDGALTAISGARFTFVVKEGNALATRHDVYTIDAAAEAERITAEEQWRGALRATGALAAAQKEEIDARITVHNGRMYAVYDDLSRRMEYGDWYYWQQRRHEFSNGWNAIVHRWNGASLDERGTILSSFHTYLADWEKWLSMTAAMEPEETFRARYDGIVQDLTAARAEEERLRDRAHTRTLRDSERDITVTEKSSVLSAKNFTREYRKDGALLSREEYEDDALVKKTEYDAAGATAHETASQYHPAGQLRRTQEYEPKDGKMALQRQTDFWRNGNARAVLDNRSDAFAYFSERGGLLYEDVARSDRAKRQRGMVDKEGNRFGLYGDEKVRNPSLMPSQYLDMLARKLDTGEKIAVFFEQFLWYANDHWDEWQTAEETVQRTEENGQSGARYMRGDCDDYAFLARAILRRQGKNAHVLLIPHHAICVWVETDAEGEYHARSLGTFGLDHNGNRYGPDYPRDRAKAGGYKHLIDALNALMKKYRYPGLGVAEGQDYTLDPENITILPNPPAGNYQRVTAEYFMEKVS